MRWPNEGPCGLGKTANPQLDGRSLGHKELGEIWALRVSRPVLHLIDGSGYIFRAYYAIRPLSTASGEPTNAVYGFSTMLEKTLREEEPKFIAITFDAGGPNFRKDMYSEYKANRPPPPEDLAVQISRIHEVVSAFSLRKLVVQGCEADDVIATLTRMALESGFDVQIITGDKDLMQLVGERVRLYEPMRGQRYGIEEVVEKYGVRPEQMADALALAGDASDNIPGVRGIGMKTAAKLLGNHGDLEGVLSAARDGGVKGKQGQTLVNSEEDARLSRRLVALDDRIELDVSKIDELAFSGPDKGELHRLFEELEFRRLLPKKTSSKNGSTTASEQISHKGYKRVTEPEELKRLAEEWTNAKEIAFSVELESRRAVDAKVYGIAIASKKGEVSYIPIAEPSKEREGLELDTVVDALRPIFVNENIKKISSDTKLAYAFFLRFGVQIAGLSMDTTVASYLLDPDESAHGDESVARRFLGHQAIVREELLKENRKRRSFDQVPKIEAAIYVAERADIAFVASGILKPHLEKNDLLHVLTDVELPLLPVLAKMEMTGIRVDVKRLQEMSGTFAEELSRLEAVCFEIAGREFNISSPKQLRELFFEELGLKIIKRTKTGPSTDHSVLEALSDSHPLPKAVLDYRQVQKLKSTYVDTLPTMVSEATGRVHTVFGQTTAATGRLSSNDPNLQNIPIRTELGRRLRQVFVVEPGNKLISVDYSQIELRVLAHFSEDAVLAKAFQDGADVHTRTASVLFETPAEQVTREQRTQAKAVNFGVLYGMGPVRLARELKIPRRTASQFVKDYFERQSGVRAFIDSCLSEARERGMVKTLLGRRRLIHDINSKNRGSRAAAERIAVNTPIQGSAADLIKLAMIRVDAVLAESFPRAKLLLQVHDELLLEANEGEAEAVAAMVKREMEHVFPLKVPLVAEASMGSNWDEAH